MGCKGCDEKKKLEQLDMFESYGKLDGIAEQLRDDVLAAERNQLGPVYTTVAYLERIEEIRSEVFRRIQLLKQAQEKLERFTSVPWEGKAGNNGATTWKGRK